MPLALETLGYSQAEIEQIVAYVNENGTIVGAPALKDEHLPVFDVAVGERAISHMGHIKMMGAAQPFISGAISKTVNMPAETTVEDIADAYTQAWQLGVKALAIYRDGSKTAQALRTDAQQGKKDEAEEPVAEARSRSARRMPKERQSITHKFSIAGHEGYITAGMYEDGTVGEIFLTDIGKEGSTLRGMMNAFATSVSIALQYGVPLETLVPQVQLHALRPGGRHRQPGDPVRQVDARLHHALAGVALPRRRHPGGAGDPDARGPRPEGGAGRADARRHRGAGRRRGERRRQRGNGRRTATDNGGNGAPVAKAGPVGPKPAGAAFTDEPPVIPAKLQGLDLGPACGQCGGMMQRTGSCYTCSSCGNNTGCG